MRGNRIDLLPAEATEEGPRGVVAHEELRKKISRELHDDISQLLLGILVHLSNFTRAAATDPAGLPRSILPLRQMIKKSIKVVHRFARELRPAMLDDLGLVPALEAYLADFPKQRGRRITFTAEEGADTLDPLRRTALYRVAQEALMNAHKRARARHIAVTLVTTPDHVCREVRDDGQAFEVGAIGSPAWTNHLGLIGMRERIEMAGGQFEIASTPGTGTTLRALLPTGRSPLPSRS
jgi:signal transduction histidine kinase